MTHNGERKIDKAENASGGLGYITKEYLLSNEELGKNSRMYAIVTVPDGSSIGVHEHIGEEESYYIISGTGTYIDDGKEMDVNPGDIFLCKDGHSHSIIANKNQDIVFIGLILKYEE
ncbi:MAG: cupin domain-containing protein [Lachnospiraceae bacterium]|jgi:mannose-6-phosphate isomerase-like protein (cupin superfamily)|nr:cupin domain-containing protein [Lachnospiraceae bacterium]